jgi:hypothetical protein
VGDERWDLPETGTVSRAALVALVVAGGAWAVAGTVRCRRATALLLPGGLVLGLAAGALHPGDDDVALLALLLAAASVAAAATGRGAMALALLALAAGCGSPGLAPAARLLAAAAVLATAAADRPLALLAALPAGVVLAGGVVEDGGWFAAGLGAAAVGVAALLTRRAASATRDVDADEDGPPAVGLGLAPAAVVGTWLLVVPGSWTWTGAQLGPYDRGMARGLVAAAAAVALAVLAPRLGPRPTARKGPLRRLGPGVRRRAP